MSGPYFFAWVMSGEQFDPEIHAVENENIFEFAIEHSEGDFATLRILIRNPRVGLLAPGRKVWAYFSKRTAPGVIEPLFYGRLIGVPEQLQDEVVELNFIARPEDYANQKAYLADSLKVAPYWDPVWFSPDTIDDPDNILESRPALWHVDRVSHAVSISDINIGEDGTIDIGALVGLYDSLNITYQQNPVRRVNVFADVSWEQQKQGVIDLTPGGMGIISYTGEGIFNAWPAPQQQVGGGWFWSLSTIGVLSGPIPSELVAQGTPDNSAYIDGGFDTGLGVFAVTPSQNIGYSYHVAIPKWKMIANLQLGYDATRRKKDIATIVLEADVQPTLTEPEDQETIDLTLSTSEVAAQGAITPDAPVYFSTPRGQQSLEYLIAVARAHLLARARAVDVSIDVPIAYAIAQDISLRKNATITDPRLPGGAATGKIKGYSLSLREGKENCNVVIGCTVGRGGTVEVSAGTPTYCEEAYCGNDYQFYTGKTVAPFASDIAYEVIEGLPAVDDGIDFNRLRTTAVLEFGIRQKITTLQDGFVPGLQAMNREPVSEQEEQIDRWGIRVDNAGRIDVQNYKYDVLHIKLKDLTGGPFETPFAVNTTQLKIAKTIDLEAA